MTSEQTPAGSGCDRVLGPEEDLAAAVGSAASGDVLGLRAGRYRVNLMPRRSLTLQAMEDAVVLDGDGLGPVLLVQEDGLDVELRGLTLTGGSSDVGGALTLGGFSKVRLVDCVLEDNRCGQGPGGACYVDRGDLELLRCRIHRCPGQGGVAIALGEVGGLLLEDSLLVAEVGPSYAALSVRDGAIGRLIGSTVVAQGEAAAVGVAGSSSQRPEVEVIGCVLQGRPSLALRAQHVGRVTVQESVLSSSAEGVYMPKDKVKVAAPMLSTATWRPSPVSPARGIYVSASKSVDLAGRERRAHGADAGALES